MKEIKFRAWDKKKNTWLNMDKYAINPDGGLGLLYCGDQDFIIEDSVEAELVQYTGIKDKFGLDIYEGDIVKNSFDEDEIGVVMFGDYMAGGRDYYAQDAYGFYLQRYRDGKILSEDDTYPLGVWSEVIGNVYENKELLNNKDK